MHKVLFISNFSKAVTGFGKNMKNVLRRLHEDPDIEVVEAANGVRFGADLRTPWTSYGTFPIKPSTLQEINSDPYKKRLAEYGNYTIDEIIEKEKPDVVVGIEDIWAFDWAKKPWIGKIGSVIWTTLDSLPILDQAYTVAPLVDKFLVWASFAEEEMNKKGFDVETLHGAVDYSCFHRLPDQERQKLRADYGLENSFVTGFVFKNQLRKSVPNLLEGFKQFKEKCSPEDNPKLLLHTDWKVDQNTWDIVKYVQEKGIDKNDILATYICPKCKNFSIRPYNGENQTCDHCGAKDSMVTKSNAFGVTEEQLNSIYNIMDVYCHPFTSGGQELPIQEAKAAGLITLVTEYSCGLDSCYEKDGGIPLKWVEYREPMTRFIKATTLPESICENLIRVKDMPQDEKDLLVTKAQKCIKDRFDADKTVARLKEIIQSFPKTSWDFNFEQKLANTDIKVSFNTNDGVDSKEWLIDIYDRMFDKKLNDLSIEIVKGVQIIKDKGRGFVYEYLKRHALEKNQKIHQKPKDITEYFEGEDEKRIVVVMPESAGDVLMMNSLMQGLKEKYPEYNIYFVTNPVFFPMIEDSPYVHKLLPFKKEMENLLLLEGQGDHKGYFDIAFLPFVGTQKYLNYMHNGLDR